MRISETVGFTILTVGFVVALLGGVHLIGNLKEQALCNQYHEATGREIKYQWSFVSSCYVKSDDGKWYLLNQIRGQE